MALKYVYTLVLLAFVNMVSAQIVIDVKSADNTRDTYEVTGITIISKAKNAKKYEHERLYGEEALAFDLATYLKENMDKEVIKVTKTAAKNEVLNISTFNSKYWDRQCFKFEEKTKSVEKKPLLGVAARPVKKGEMGLGVSRIVPNSGAEAAGILESDVILTIEGETVYTNCDLTQAIGSYAPNDALDIDVARDGKKITIPAVLGYRIQTKSDWVAVCSEEDYAPIVKEVTTTQLGDLDVFPNPTSGVAQINYQSELEGKLDFVVEDITGRVLYSLTQENFSGNFNQSVDLTGKPAGMYFLHIIHNGETKTEKLVLQHRN